MFKEDEKGPTCFALNKPVLAGCKNHQYYNRLKHMKSMGLSGTFKSWGKTNC